MAVAFLFQPATVAGLLAGKPNLATRIAPLREGGPSTAFPSYRKTERQIYRILSNQHYPHLVEFTEAVETCLAHGWEHLSLLRTRALTSFDSEIAVLFVADCLIANGFHVENPDAAKGSDSVPDIYAASSTDKIRVEVYCPRDYEEAGNFTDELMLALKNLDAAFDYAFEVRLSLLNDFTPDGRPLFFDPGSLGKLVATPTDRTRIIDNLVRTVESGLPTPGGRPIETSERLDAANVLVEVRVTDIQGGSSIPDRVGTVMGPGLTGHAPEGMFDRLVQHRVLPKIRQRQVGTPGATSRIVLVDLSKLPYTHEFNHEFYRRTFANSIDSFLTSTTTLVDAVVFCLVEGRRQLRLPFVFSRPGFGIQLLEQMFGGPRHFRAVSSSLFEEVAR